MRSGAAIARRMASEDTDGKFLYAPLDLNALRNQLVRLEDTIIFGLVERASFKQNPAAYDPKGITVKGAAGALQFQGSYFSYYLTENEKVHARMRRYTSPDEHPFTQYNFLPKPVLPELKWPKTLCEPTGKWNLNDKILDFYMKKVIPSLCEEGNDQHYGSSVTLDVSLLQALSKRINYGKFVAEIKYRKNRALLRMLRERKDIAGIRKMITKPDVEAKILQRVQLKAVAYGNADVLSVIDDEITEPKQKKIDAAKGKINPKDISKLYEEIMEMTKQVQMKYLLERPLDE
mmetsp:Transcript_5467/g.8084  ORF Transcript_5467/g.8084 Transcript_5467/m.8084 type:complete len:290 (+) Transcript_5467:662-1531(+)|eukprot:CAMPEP_0167753904 /NCGR_PEP_ID=MMETSP0110_2-20121227/7975_1 /TAXON_ID=629695 /ORGANISM="Gymnochlora sp., Strain CCMP2014" /LENGTH=289 /DNA_ID=CAMNT_0007639727 /DNA_START=641 /DNA_END=1510 /DNA_ORIENTATION=+